MTHVLKKYLLKNKNSEPDYLVFSVKGFSAIELVMTLLIIGFIFLLFIPVLSSLKGEAISIQCLNNLRQHGIAWRLYLEEHGNLFPKWGYLPQKGETTDFSYGGKKGVNNTEEFNAKNRVLNKYLNINDESSPNIELFHCPADRAPNWMGYTFFDFAGTSYIANASILNYSIGSQDGSVVQVPRPLTTITRPRNKVFLEACISMNKPGHGGSGESDYPKIPVMVLFVDGHVKGPFYWNDDFEHTVYDNELGRPIYSKGIIFSSPDGK